MALDVDLDQGDALGEIEAVERAAEDVQLAAGAQFRFVIVGRSRFPERHAHPRQSRGIGDRAVEQGHVAVGKEQAVAGEQLERLGDRLEGEDAPARSDQSRQRIGVMADIGADVDDPIAFRDPVGQPAPFRLRGAEVPRADEAGVMQAPQRLLPLSRKQAGDPLQHRNPPRKSNLGTRAGTATLIVNK